MKKSICTRILSAVLSFLMAASLVACTTVSGPSTEPSGTTTPSAPTAPSNTLLPPVIPNRVTYTRLKPSGMIMRELSIKAGLGGEKVVISQLTDAHLNYCNEEDLKDPVLASTYEHRTWKKDNASLGNLQNTLKEAAKDSDLMVITGDLYDYCSQGVIETVQEHVFGKYDNILACLGNHEIVRQVQGKVEDTMTEEQIREILAGSWCNDIYYASQIIKNKVMIIVIDNSSSHFFAEQVPLLTADLQKAREHGYVVLMFYHIPLLTGDPSDNYKSADSEYYTGNWSFGTEVGHNLVGAHSSGADKQIYDLICNNGDIIYGTFCGHVHGDFYTEIHAKTAAGEEIMIPQYAIQGTAYDRGHFLKITIE